MNKSLSITLIFDWARPLVNFSLFDIGSKRGYYAADEAQQFRAWYQQYAYPALTQITENTTPVSLYCSGTFIDMLSAFDAAMVKTLKTAIKKGHIELLGGTYHHSLSSLYDRAHFQREVHWHKQLIQKKLGTSPSRFFNTSNIYYNDLAPILQELGYNSSFTGAIDWYLSEHKSERIFSAKSETSFDLLLITSDQGQSLFQNDEIQHHFLQLAPDELMAIGGWSELIRKTKNKATIYSLKTQIDQVEKKPIYNVRQPISGTYDYRPLDSLNTHPLQISWLKQLNELSTAMAVQSEEIQKLWSGLSAANILEKLNPNAGHEDTSYNTYQTLINIFSNLQFRLRQ
ncbi:hypothetical protein N7E81_01250 [Reichenbachiella carrageenanivorans]|uniref:Glycoside hydrolase family 57 N-terminal domain-containing protein n=1 Tax=Reichenbachiella carrageenanivorans TaxID=2979869 RepID=A0ABY6D0Q5_9BACT|nr:hypothetical protein [Reichenbachiella carrageenanivorans]UXX79736.1 hypothetical protein N7E81_01250 [Reichenbachiella carrageenanivorans]